MKLHLGIMNNKELAEWFGITESSFKRAKKKKLEELTWFAKFEEVKGKVNVLEIYVEEYLKNKERVLTFTKEMFDKVWQSNGLDTCSRVSAHILEIAPYEYS